MSKVMKDYKYHFGLKLRIYPDYHQRKIKVAVKMLRLLTENSERNKRQHFSDDEISLIEDYRALDDANKQVVGVPTLCSLCQKTEAQGLFSVIIPQRYESRRTSYSRRRRF